MAHSWTPQRTAVNQPFSQVTKSRNTVRKYQSRLDIARQIVGQLAMATIGYARVSTERQNLEQQQDALYAAGVEKIFDDKRSGARNDRPGLTDLLNYIRPGDVVVVVALDRLGRSLSGIIRTIETLSSNGVALRSLRESIDTTTAVGNMLVGVFGALAEYERTLINERAEAAREALRARGGHVGRKRVISADQLRAIQALRAAGEPMSTICATTGLARSTIYKALSETA